MAEKECSELHSSHYTFLMIDEGSVSTNKTEEGGLLTLLTIKMVDIVNKLIMLI